MPSYIRALKILIGTLLILAVLACNSSPTVPLPPPEMIVIEPPNDTGYTLVRGEPEAAEDGDMVYIFNEDLLKGVITMAEEDGSFEALIEAQAGDELTIRLERDGELLSGEVTLFVPNDG